MAYSTAGAAAGAASVLVSMPCDVIKTRLQVLTAAPGGRGLSAGAVARGMWAAEGPSAFWAGLSARLLHIAPGCALSWALYEHVKARLGGGGGGG